MILDVDVGITAPLASFSTVFTENDQKMRLILFVQLYQWYMHCN